MAQISTSQTGAVMTFGAEDWIAGLAVNGQFGNPYFESPAIGKGAEKIGNINPFTAYGILQPGLAAVNVANNSVLGGVVVAGVIQGSQYGYLIDGGGKVQKYDYASATTNGLINTGVFPHTITGTGPVGKDIVIYKHNVSNVPTFSVFYSYYNAANWNVGALLSFTTFDDDYMSTVPVDPLVISSGDGDDPAQRTSPHCLEIGTDDILYIGSGRYLHAFDGSTGTDGTFISRVLTLPAGFTVVALKKFQDVMLIAGNYNTDSTANIGGEALLYSWNYIDLDITEAVPLEDPSVVSLFLWKGVPYVITVGEREGRGTNKLKALIGNNVTLKSTFDLVPPINRGVDASSDVIFINCGGSIVQIGDPYTGELKPTHFIATCNAMNNDAPISGWIKNLGNDPVGFLDYGMVASSASVFSGGTNSLSTFGFKTGSNPTWQTTCIYRHPYTQIPCPPGKQARLMNIIVEHYRTFTAADFFLTVDYNYGNATSIIFVNQSSLSAPLTKQYKNDYQQYPLKASTNIRFQFNWGNIATASANPPAVSRLHFIFEYLDLPANT